MNVKSSSHTTELKHVRFWYAHFYRQCALSRSSLHDLSEDTGTLMEISVCNKSDSSQTSQKHSTTWQSTYAIKVILHKHTNKQKIQQCLTVHICKHFASEHWGFWASRPYPADFTRTQFVFNKMLQKEQCTVVAMWTQWCGFNPSVGFFQMWFIWMIQLSFDQPTWMSWCSVCEGLPIYSQTIALGLPKPASFSLHLEMFKCNILTLPFLHVVNNFLYTVIPLYQPLQITKNILQTLTENNA